MLSGRTHRSRYVSLHAMTYASIVAQGPTSAVPYVQKEVRRVWQGQPLQSGLHIITEAIGEMAAKYGKWGASGG